MYCKSSRTVYKKLDILFFGRKICDVEIRYADQERYYARGRRAKPTESAEFCVNKILSLSFFQMGHFGQETHRKHFGERGGALGELRWRKIPAPRWRGREEELIFQPLQVLALFLLTSAIRSLACYLRRIDMKMAEFLDEKNDS